MNKVRDYLSRDIKEFNVKLLVISGILFLFVVGLISYKTTNNSYALFSNNVTGSKVITVHYDDNDKTLYGVLRKEATRTDISESNKLARTYTGEHQDSMDSSKSNKTIYHWYANTDANGTAIQDRNNVVFANHCWQMIRTTDTGGVRMIYNGEYDETNKCNQSRSNHIGYAQRTSQTLSNYYWYGTDYTYDKTNNNFKISGTTEQKAWNETTWSNLIGKYTCMNVSSVNDTCSILYLVESYYNTSSAYVIPINTSSHYSQFGTLQFNASNSSPADVGYMYNTRYTYNSKSTSTEKMLSSSSLATSYWYANNAVWGTPTANNYNLDNPYQVSSTSDYPSLVGKYTFRNSTQTYTDTSVYYIAAVNNTTMYYIQLSSGNNLAYYNYTYTYGDSYTDNGNGTYTINNPTTINRADWYTGYSSVGANKYVCKNATNNTCSDLWYTTATSRIGMTYIKVSDNYKYAKGFAYDSNTNTYTLNSESVSFGNISDSTNKTSLNNAHYTCWNTSGTCSTLSYIYYISGAEPYYINLTGGKSVNDALEKMLSSNDVNTTNSIIKSGVDFWYKKYLYNDYDSYIDDTIYCNDRSIRALNGWNPNGGNVTQYLQFKENTPTSDLSCANQTDRFSISNNKAKLTYKVGLMSSPEMNLLYSNNTRKTGQYYWLASPDYFGYALADGRYVNPGGYMSSHRVDNSYGVRPSVSLISGIEYSSGDGSMNDPYVVKMNNN